VPSKRLGLYAVVLAGVKYRVNSEGAEAVIATHDP
jgi:hypothetical protein